jgi:PAS domain S-box-containing protein
LNHHGFGQAPPSAGASTASLTHRDGVEARQAVALGVIFFALALGSLVLVHRSGRISPLWPANGVVLFCLLRTPTRRWPSLLLAGLVGNLTANLAGGDAAFMGIGFALSNSLEIALGAAALRRIVGPDIDLTRNRDLVAFGGLAGVAAPLCSAWFIYNWMKPPLTPDAMIGLGTWVLADGLGAAIVVPALLAIQPSAFRMLWAPGTLASNLVQLAVLGVVLVLAFGQSRYPLAVLAFPALLWITFRLEFLGAALGVLLTAAIALAFALIGRGPSMLLYSSPFKQVIALQSFLAIAAFSILPVAAALTRSRQLKASLAASLRAAEAARAESQEAQRWARMAQQIADVGYFRLADEPGASRWSEEIYRIHGVDPAHGPLNATIEVIHPDDRARVEAGLRAARRDAKPFSGQYRIRRSDGAWRTVACRTISERDDAGQVTAVVGALVDVTAFKMIEAAALESEARYRLLAEKSSDIISRIDIEGRQTYVSSASGPIVGYAPEELMGRMAMDFVHPDDQEALYQAFDSQADSGHEHASQPIRYRYRHKNGDWIWLESHPTVIFDENREAVEFITVSRDVTRAKAAEAELTAAREAAEAVAQAKSEFLANMSHEIRTPLTSIMGFSGLLKRVENLPDNARPYVERIATAGESLLSVVNDILDFSKLEAGQLELDPQAFEPKAFLQETAQLLAVQAANKGLTLGVAFDGPAPPLVSADIARLRQVLLNLIGNAIKFTDQGAVTVHAAYDESDEGRLRVSVSDTGRGIPPERRDRLFQRFSQIDGSVSRTYGDLQEPGRADGRRVRRPFGRRPGLDLLVHHRRADRQGRAGDRARQPERGGERRSGRRRPHPDRRRPCGEPRTGSSHADPLRS